MWVGMVLAGMLTVNLGLHLVGVAIFNLICCRILGSKFLIFYEGFCVMFLQVEV